MWFAALQLYIPVSLIPQDSFNLSGNCVFDNLFQRTIFHLLMTSTYYTGKLINDSWLKIYMNTDPDLDLQIWLWPWHLTSASNKVYRNVKVQDGTWTFEHKFLKKLLMSNVYLKDMPLAGHLYRVTMQKVPRIPRQNTKKNHVQVQCVSLCFTVFQV